MFYMYCIIVILYVPRHVVRVNKISIYLSIYVKLGLCLGWKGQ